MKHFKRAIISIIRQPSKSLILFFVILVLGIFASSAISIAQAIQNTEVNLLRRIPPVATVDTDMMAINEYERLSGELPQLDAVTRVLLEEIGHLPYVRDFDFALYDWLDSSELELPMRTELMIEEFVVKGVHNRAVIDLEEGIIELLQGRLFTQEEMEAGSSVVLISQAFADINQLSLGSVFTLRRYIYDTFDVTGVFSGSFDPNQPDAPLLEVHEFDFEVIGIFASTIDVEAGEASVSRVDWVNHAEFNARLYVPITAVESNRQMFYDYIHTFHPDSLAAHYSLLGVRDVIFALYDSLDIAPFHEAASALLPEFWMIDDLRSEFAAMSSSLVSLQGVSNGIIIGVSISSIVILGLLILLFLHDRKNEIGVYLALGELRKNIIAQMLIETIIVSIGALTISLFIGNMIASTMTYSMLRQDLIYNSRIIPSQDLMIQCFNRMGFSVQMRAEEMLAAYDMTLDGMTILMFAGVAIVMITLSTILPIVYLTRLKPKDILTKSSIG